MSVLYPVQAKMGFHLNIIGLTNRLTASISFESELLVFYTVIFVNIGCF